MPSDRDRTRDLLGEAKKLAREYRALTGKPLGITGEIAEFEAATILGLELAGARQAGHDAVEVVDGQRRRLQIKGRCLLDDRKPSQRLGSINTAQKDWDAVLMVLLDQNFDALEIHEAERAAVEAALADKPRTDISLSKFRSLGRLRWQRSTTVATGGSAPRYDRNMRKDRKDRFILREDDIEIVSRASSTPLPIEKTIDTAMGTSAAGEDAGAIRDDIAGAKDGLVSDADDADD